MNTVQRIAKNTGVLLAANVISKILSFFYVMYMARCLGVQGFGILSFALAFTGIFSVFTDLGLRPLMIREVARDKSLASKYFANVGAIKVILVAVTFGLISLTINLLGYPKQTIKVVYFVALSVIFGTFSQMFYSVFQAFEKMEYQSFGQILDGVLMLMGVIFGVKYDFNVVGFACLYVIARAFVLGFGFFVMVFKFRNLLSAFPIEITGFDWSFWKHSLKEAWPMGAKVICVMIYVRIDQVMLSLMKGDTTLGLYSAAHRLSEISMIIPLVFTTSLFPVMAKYHKDYKSSFANAYGKSVKYLLYLALPMAFIVTLLARPIVNLIFGADFSGSVIALQILIWATALSYIGVVQGATFVTANKQMLNLKLVIIGVILNVILNLILIPKYTYLGASIATVVTRIFVVVSGLFFLSRCGYKVNILGICVPPFLGLFTTGVAALILINMGVNILIISTVFIVIYTVIVYIAGIKQDDKDLIGKIFNLSKIEA